MICDESHYLKSWKAQRTQALTGIIKNASRAFLLTGTPAINRPIELFPQLQALYPRIFPNFWEFSKRYCDEHLDRYVELRLRKIYISSFGKTDNRGNSNLKELHCLTMEVAVIRRKKDQVLTQLPAKRRSKVTIEIPNNCKKIMKKITDDLNAVKDQLSGLIDRSSTHDSNIAVEVTVTLKGEG